MIGAGMINISSSQFMSPISLIALDSFNRSDSTTMGNLESSQAWSASSGWGIISGSAYDTSTATADRFATVELGRSNNIAISADVLCVGGSVAGGVSIRKGANTDGITVAFDGTTFLISRIINGSWTGLATMSSAGVAGTTYRVRAEVTGTTIKAYLNGVLKLTATDSNPALANNAKHGLFKNARGNNAMRFDNFKVEAI